MLPSNHLDHLSTLLPSTAFDTSCPLAAAPPGLVAPSIASWPLGPKSSTSCSCRSCPARLTASNRNINRAISAKHRATPSADHAARVVTETPRKKLAGKVA